MLELGFLMILGLVYIAAGTTKFRIASPRETRPDAAGQRELRWYPQNAPQSTQAGARRSKILVRNNRNNMGVAEK